MYTDHFGTEIPIAFKSQPPVFSQFNPTLFVWCGGESYTVYGSLTCEMGYYSMY